MDPEDFPVHEPDIGLAGKTDLIFHMCAESMIKIIPLFLFDANCYY